ncbi:MAG: NFACT family protein, partial [Armatimonadota bacterium]|nr:NFACT family protein [Armatimonadota bacterium]
MPYDSLVLSAVTAELQESLLNDRVNTVQQPDALTVAISFGRKGRLLLSAHPEYARVHLSITRLPKLPQPPGFCMLLRKYLEESRLRSIRQPHFDRVLELEFTRGEEPVWLVAELMGRHSNLFLRSHEGIILGAIKPVPASVNRLRVTTAGSPYAPPPATGRTSPLEGSSEEAAAWLMEGEPEKTLRGQMGRRWTGTSPVMIDWLCQQAQLDPEWQPIPSQKEPLAQALTVLRGIIADSSFRPNGSIRLDKPGEDVWALPSPYPTVKTTPFPNM